MTYEEELKTKVEKVFDAEQYNHQVVTVQLWDGSVTVEVTRMYEYVPFDFKKLKELSEVFGTEEFNVDGWHAHGCETCDWGSKYTKTFTFKKN